MKKRKNSLIILVLVFLLLFLFICCVKFIGLELYYRNKEAKYIQEIYEKNQKTVFRISKIITHSSAEAIDNSDNLQDFDISQYSDLVVLIDNKTDIKELTEENTVKELYIDNFKILPKNLVGKNQSLYYKNPYNIGKYRKLDYDKIEEKLTYDIIFNNNDNKQEFYTTPVFFTDCSNPISIGYINEKIYTNYSVSDTGIIAYDGRILDEINMDLEKIKPHISFTIHIKNNLNENFACNVSLDVNLKNNEGTIYSGYFAEIKENFENKYKFLKL